MTRPVLLTGVGAVHPAVVGGAPELARGLGSPPSASGRTVEDGALRGLLGEGEARRLSRVCQLAVAAARRALTDAGLDPDAEVGVVLGTEYGDFRSTIAFADGYLDGGPAALSALLFPNTVMNTMAAAAAIAIRARQVSLTFNAATVAGEQAVAHAAAAVARGSAPCLLAGGVDELVPLVRDLLISLGGRGALEGEGAVWLVLESAEAARARGGRVLGEIAGVGAGSLLARPHGVGRPGPSPALTAALECAGLDRDEIGWAYLSASGDTLRDGWEAAVLHATLGRPVACAALRARYGAHAATAVLGVAAAAWTARSGLLLGPAGELVRVPSGPGVVYALARGGAEVALVIR
jgi:3-oxoacyl-[acyl-carrier-protein] synthase II